MADLPDDVEDILEDMPDVDVEDVLDENFELPLGIKFGSPEAKVWWRYEVQPTVESAVTDELREEYGDKVVGVWKGKPLVPGERGAGQGDFQYMVDRLRVVQGYDEERAARIAGAINRRIYG